LPLGLLVLKSGAGRLPEEVEAEAVALVRDRIGPSPASRRRSSSSACQRPAREILRGTMRAIAAGEEYRMPATIDDPAILGEIAEKPEAGGITRNEAMSRA